MSQRRESGRPNRQRGPDCTGIKGMSIPTDSVSNGGFAVGFRPGTQAGLFELFILVVPQGQLVRVNAFLGFRQFCQYGCNGCSVHLSQSLESAMRRRR